jgi:hypothetical protein
LAAEAIGDDHGKIAIMADVLEAGGIGIVQIFIAES